MHRGARLADDVEVGAYSVIGEHVKWARGCGSARTWCSTGTLHRPAQPHLPLRVDRRAAAGQEVRRTSRRAVEIGDDNTIREYVTINRGTAQDVGVTRLGNDNWVMAYVHFAHDCQIGNKTIFANACQLAGHVVVGDWAIFGATTLVHQFVHIGAHAFTGMGTYLPQDLPPYVMAAGNMARHSASTARACGAAASPRDHPGAEARLPHALRSGGPWTRQARAQERRHAPIVRGEADPRVPGRTARAASSARWPELPRVGMVAGEASGDLLAAHLIAALKARRRPMMFAGIGGPRMTAQGFESHFPMEKLSVRGYAEVLKNYLEIMVDPRRRQGDDPRAAGAVHRRGLERLQPRPRATAQGRRHPDDPLREPSVWAWRWWRIKKIARGVTLILAMFPFEKLPTRRPGSR